MSQRCRGQANTEDIVQRVRSIILMYRPHLAGRVDLQLPELTMEALMPNSTGANQITHNFNYKYDYNTNVPNAYNPFVPQQPPQQSPPQQQIPQQTPLQSFTFNAAPSQVETGASMPTTTVTATTSLTIEQSDLATLNVLYANAQRTPDIASYKQLLRHIVFLVRKYMRYEQITAGLELLETFDSLQTNNNDIAELLQCIHRETGWILPNGPSVCRWLSYLISSYCRIVARVTKRELVLSSIRTEDKLRAVVADVEKAVVDTVDAVTLPPPQIITPEAEAIKNQQIEILNTTVEQQRLEMTRMQTRHTSLQQQYDTAQSKTLTLGNAFDKLRNYYRSNVSAPSPDDDQELVSRLIQHFNHLQSEQTQTVTTVSQQTETMTQQAKAYAQLQQEYAQTRQQYEETIAVLESRINESDAYMAEINLKLSSYEDAQSQLRAAQAKNDQLQTHIKSLNDKYDSLLENYKNLEKKSSKPIRKVKAIRRNEPPNVNAKLIAETQQLLKDQKTKNIQLQEMKNRYVENVESTSKVIEMIKNDLQKTRLQVESLVSNQAALSASDLKALNKKSAQNLADEVSLLRAENQAVKNVCDTQVNEQSAKLMERLEDTKTNLMNKIDKLMEQVVPIQNRIEQSTSEIQQLKSNVEQMGRKEAIKPIK